MAFESEATNLVPGDTNLAPDVFVRSPINPGASLDLLQGMWRLIGLPLRPGPRPRDQIASLFGDELTGTYGDTWQVYGWDAAAQSTGDALGLAGPLVPGTGYWLRRLAGSGGDFIQMDGVLQPKTDGSFLDIPVTAESAGPWQLLGNPWEHAVAWSDVRVVYGTPPAEHTLVEAEADGVMDRVGWTWSGAAFQACDPLAPALPGRLDVWAGAGPSRSARVCPAARSL